MAMTVRLFGSFIIAIVLTASLACVTSLSSQAFSPKDTDASPIAVYKKAGINPKQEKQILSLVGGFQETARARAKEVIGLLDELRELSLEPDPDPAIVLSKQSQINELNSKMGTDRIRLMLNIRSVLTGKQKKKLVELMKAEARSKPQ